MAFPAVETTAESSTNTAGTSHVVTLPAGIAAGDLILVLADKGSTAATFNTHADYTELVDENLATGITIWVRDAAGGESNPTFTSSAATRSACIAYRISGAESIAVRAPQLSTVATGTSANPNATTCTPTGGAKDYLWITMFGQAGEQADDDSLTTVTPAGFTNPIEKTCGTAGTNFGGMIASAQQQLNAASLDATAWTSSDTTAWRAYTIAVHPSSAVTGTVAVTQDDQTSAASGTVAGPSEGSFTISTRTSQQATGVTNHTVTLPDGSNVAGKRVAIWFASESTVGWPAGWTEIFEGSTTSTVLAVAERIIDGTEGFDGVDDTITVTTGSASQSNAHAYLISGAHASTASEAATAATGSGANADPPSIDPAGWGTEEALFIAGAAYRFNTSFSAPPTDYTNLLSLSGGDDNAPLGTARRVVTAASDDPGTFTSADGSNWVATTIAVRVASGGDTTTGTVAVTQADQTSAATGQLGYSGTAAATQVDQTSSAAGQLGYSGTVAVTQAGQTSTATGQLGYSGTLATTQADQTSSASGTVAGVGEVSGTVAVTQDDQTSTAIGGLGYSGAVAVTQADQIATAAGQLGVTGTVAVTQEDQSGSADGWIAIVGTVAVTQEAQVPTMTGFVGEIPVIPDGLDLVAIPDARGLAAVAASATLTAERDALHLTAMED